MSDINKTDGSDSYITMPVIEASALCAFFDTDVKDAPKPEVLANAVVNAFDAMMEGAALMLDLVGQIEFTYVTKSGNSVHVVMDSP